MNRLAGAAVAVIVALAGRAAAGQELALASCELPGVVGQARCGSLMVPEDPDGRRMIRLNVVVLSATGAERAPDQLFFLAGGPGQAAAEWATTFGRALAGVRRTRDLVFVDQRGTGKSAPLRCDITDPERLLRAVIAFEFPADRLAECRRSYTAALQWYGTTQAAQDLERVRVALRVERVNLFGGSYGTRLGLTYMRMYPDRVRSAVLAGVAPPAFAVGGSVAADADSALAAVGRECAAQPSCAAIAPDLPAMTRAVATRLEQAPAQAAWIRSSDTVAVKVDRTLFVAGTRFLLYAGPYIANLPSIVREAQDGNFGPFIAGIGAFAGRLNDQVALGLFLSVLCTEDIDRIDAERYARSAGATLLRTVGTRGLIDACRDWPRGTVPAGFFDPVTAAVPTLMFSGASDPVTPPWHAERQAAALPNALHIVIPHAAHVDLQACEFGIVTQFVERGSISGLGAACSATRPPRTFAGRKP